MRKSPGKDYGYVILPIGVPAGADTNSVLDNNDKYRVIWEVLNALRSLDERFDATINKLELNKKKPDQIQIIGVGDAPEGGELEQQTEQLAMMLTEEDLSDLERAIYGKIVRKVGNVRYWEDWSKDVAEIAQQHMLRIRVMLEDTNSEAYKEFQKFIKSLRYNINDSISETQAIEMLAQHLITKPVFEALFDSYSFVMNNPVSKSMDKILEILDEQGLMKEQEKLESFYESVRVRAQGVDNLKAKQDIIIQLYDKFFKVGFKETTERLGIVFTPTEVVDFIIHSVDDVLKKHFGKSLASEGVHVLDPFTGTGTFVTRLLQSGLIPKEDLLRKYTQEIHANEIVLLSYYIAAINIEETFHSLYGGEYVPFEGIVLTDTFESTEKKNSFIDELFDENNARLKRQQEEPIFAIIGNPPYSKGQANANDNNQNIEYPNLDEAIDDSYGKYSKAVLKRSLYDNYVRAFKWAADRVSENGVIGFVSNNSFIDSQSMDGLRKVWFDEFNYIYIINLRGDQRTQGELSRKEGGKIFGSGSRTGIAITLLIKDGSENHVIKYMSADDFLSREQKLTLLNEKKSLLNLSFKNIVPDKNNDWINQRDEKYEIFTPLFSENESVFDFKLIGINTNRDSWVYNYSESVLKENVGNMVDNYNNEVRRLGHITNQQEKLEKKNSNDNFVKWTAGLDKKLVNNEIIELDSSKILTSMYRPYTKKRVFYQREIIERPGKFDTYFGSENLAICVTGAGAKKEFSAMVTDTIPNLNMLEAGTQVFLMKNNDNANLLNEENVFSINEAFSKRIKLEQDEVFYYVYGVLHSPEYREKYGNDLKKALPRIPIVKEKNKFVNLGKQLVNLHLNYENYTQYNDFKVEFSSNNPSYKVNKMKFIKKGRTDVIVFNSEIKIYEIPDKAYKYVISGRSAIEWIIDQYQIKEDKKSGIIDDPNKYTSDEKYILNLLISIINVSLKTVELIEQMPPLEILD